MTPGAGLCTLAGRLALFARSSAGAWRRIEGLVLLPAADRAAAAEMRKASEELETVAALVARGVPLTDPAPVAPAPRPGAAHGA